MAAKKEDTVKDEQLRSAELKIAEMLEQAQKEAQRQAIMFEESIKFGTTDNTHIRFQQYAEIWLKDYAEVELAPKTVCDYKHLMPAINAEIGYLYLDKITPTHLIRLRDKLSQTQKETRYTVRENLKQKKLFN